MSTVLRVSTHIYGVSKEIDGKMFIFRVKLGMWLLKSIFWEKQACSEGYNTHLWGLWGDRWKNVPFESKPRHVTPQIKHFRKASPNSEGFNTYLWCLQGDRWQNIHFYSKPRHVTLKSIVLKNEPCSEGFNTHLWGFHEKIDGKMFLLRVNLGMWPLKFNHLGKASPVLRVSTHIYGVFARR